MIQLKRSTTLGLLFVATIVFAGAGQTAVAPGFEPPDGDHAVAVLPAAAPTVASPEELLPDVQLEPTPEPTAAPGPISVTDVEYIAPFTGEHSPSSTDDRWNIIGTDLGFSFEHKGETMVVFGDTWGWDGVEGDDWRSNVMVTVEQNPEHGWIITDAITNEIGFAKELLPSLKRPEREYTVIPTTGISVGDRMYLHYMSVRDWDKQWWGYKEPLINGSGFAYSDDDGQTWVKDEVAFWEGDSNFAHASMVEHDGYIYVFGTTADRFGPLQIFRVKGEDLLHPDQYRYWDGDDWNPDPATAVDIVPWPIGEFAVRWSEYHERWFLMYKNEKTHNVVLRTAEALTGPWDDERIIATAEDYPKLYAPLLLPIDGPEVYFIMSMFFPDYQTYLMRMTIENNQ